MQFEDIEYPAGILPVPRDCEAGLIAPWLQKKKKKIKFVGGGRESNTPVTKSLILADEGAT